jgi:predicted dehydrogenase
VGAIGVNGMGWANVTAALKVPGVNVTALCDVDKNVLDKRMGELGKMNIDSSKVKTYGDYRKLLDDKDVDIVIVGTPDHWHALQMIHACEAGKDVYVEKPVVILLRNAVVWSLHSNGTTRWFRLDSGNAASNILKMLLTMYKAESWE